MGGQLRVVSGMASRVIGYDMAVAYTMADSLGLDRLAVTELLPLIEQEMVSAMNDITGEDDEWQNRSQSD